MRLQPKAQILAQLAVPKPPSVPGSSFKQWGKPGGGPNNASLRSRLALFCVRSLEANSAIQTKRQDNVGVVARHGSKLA